MLPKQQFATPLRGQKPIFLLMRNNRRLKLLEILAREPNITIADAGRAAGYKESYAAERLSQVIKNDVQFCTLVERRKAEIRAQGQDETEKAVSVLDKIIYDGKSPRNAVIKALQLKLQLLGLLIERKQVEDVSRQRELDESRRHEAEVLAKIRFGQKVS